MATFAALGWIGEEDELNSIYIRKDSYVAPGQLGTYNSATGTFDLLPPGTNSYVLSADSGSTYGLTWIPAPNEDIQAGASGVESGASGLTITTPSANITTLALANSGVTANTYGTATDIPVLTIDARGRITAATTTPVAPPTDQLASIPIRNWKAGSFSSVGLNDSVAVGDLATAAVESVVIGSAANDNGSNQAVVIGRQAGISGTGLESINIGYRASSLGQYAVALGGFSGAPPNSIAIGRFSGNLNSTGQRNTYLGVGAVDKLNANTDVVSVGYQASAGNQGTALGASTSALAECTVAGYDAETTGIMAVSIGHSSRAAAECVSIGWQAGSVAITGVGCTFVGLQAYGGAGFTFQTAIGSGAGCSGDGATAIGGGARAGASTVCINGFADVQNSTVVGTLSLASGNNSQIFGYNNRGGASIGNVILGANSGHNGLLAGSTANVFAGSNIVSATLTTGVSNTFLGSNISVSGAAVSNAVAVGAGITNVASGSISIGLLSSGSATSAISIGQSNDASAQDSISIGRSGLSSAQYAISIGQGSQGSDIDSLAICRGSVASAQYTISIGQGSQATNIDSLAICRGSVASAQNALVIGPLTSAAALATGSCVIGASAFSGAIAQVSLGRNARSEANADYSITIGDGSVSNAIGCVTVGNGSTTNAVNCITIGRGLTNSEANTSLIGYDVAHISKFTGFIKSYRSMCCAVGLIETEPSQLYNAGTGVVQRLNLVSTRYNSGGMNIDLVNNEVQLGNFPDDNGTTFRVSLMIDGSADLPSSVFRFRIMWLATGFTAPGGNRVAHTNCETTLTTLLTNTTITTDINVPPLSGSPNLVWCDVTRLSPIGELTVTAIRFTVSRNA